MRVLILVPELDGNFVVLEREQLFAELVIILLLPLPGQKLFNFGSSVEKPPSVTPNRVGRIGLSYDFGISAEVVRM